MKRSSSSLLGSARILVVLGVGALAASCNDIDTTRQKVPQATFGDDFYGVMCDRVGAQVFQEDLSGESYRGICHFDSTGAYADTVDVSHIPRPTSAVAIEARRISVAKMEALARRRSDLVRAFNALFPDTEIPDITSKDPNAKVRFHDALLALGQGIVPLYETDPYNPGGEALTPATTRALGTLFDALATTDTAKQMLSEMWGRKGYRPFQVGLGAIRSTLGYPNLRNFTVSSLGVLGPTGSAAPQLQQMLAIGKREMLHAKVEIEPLPQLSLDAATAQLNRPRSNIELFRDMLLTQSDEFANTESDPVRLLSIRDKRGFVIPAGNTPGLSGTVPDPFVDMDGDGFADVDAAGRFVDASGSPLSIANPFVIPGVDSDPGDEYGRADPNLYTYVDTSRTLAAGLVRQMVPLLDGTQYADAGDPEAYLKESETVMYALAGSYDLFGAREDAEYDFDNDKVVPVGTDCPSCFKYSRFKGEESPFTDLIHASGQLLGDPDSDAVMLGMIDLLQNHEHEVARLVGAALKVKQISDQHDALAAQGKEYPSGLPYENPVWDQIAQIADRITAKPGLTAQLLGAIADKTTVTAIDGSGHMGDAVSSFAAYRDLLDYDPNNLNGPALNLSVGPTSTSDPVTPIDYKANRSGDNRSLLEKAMLLIHDAKKAKACNKQGATVDSKLGGLTISYPPVGSPYDECELFEMDNLADFYLDSLLDPSHPKRSTLILKAGTLSDLLDFISDFGVSIDDLFQNSSGIDGMTLHPSPRALNRLVWFGAYSDAWGKLPDYDALNDKGGGGPYAGTSKFIYDLMEPAGSQICPPNSNGVSTCATVPDLIRMRDGKAIFSWERLGFYDYLRPMITTFVNSTCNADVSFCDKTDLSGEDMFVDLIDTFYQQWPGTDHGTECDPKAAKTAINYCSGAGLNRYEPIIADAGKSDLIPALNEFAKAAHDVSKITIARGPNAGKTLTGADVLEITTKILFSQDYANKIGMVDRDGKKSTTWTDGTVQGQLTMFNLFTNGLHKIDVAFDANGEDGAKRKKLWKRARSQLVDSFLAIEGDGENAHFKNKSTAQTLIAVLQLARQQINANCPNRENGVKCTWATKDLANKFADTVSGPMFAGMVDMTEAVRQNEPARREMERYLTYLLKSEADGTTLQATLASMEDVMQVLTDDAKLAPLIQSASVAMTPDGDPSPGCADRTVRVLTALTDDKYDKYHVLDYVLANLVTPINDGGPAALSPLEIIMDSIADIHRLDPSTGDALSPDDYGAIMGTVRDFLTSKERGLEQIYSIINNRQRK